MPILRRQVANYHVIPEPLLSPKHAEAGTCGIIIEYIHNTCQEKTGLGFQRIKQPTERETSRKPSVLPRKETKRGPSR